jgi:four helix bundle protein
MARKGLQVLRFERLRVWHTAIELYDAVDDMVEGLTRRDRLILADQLRRADLSVSSNIAEGSGRETAKDSQHFYTVAKGSAFEVVSIAAVCQRRGRISPENYREIYPRAEDIAKMLSGLKRVGHPM